MELPHAREFLQFCRQQKLRTFLLSAVHQDHFAVQAAAIGFHDFLDRPYLGVWDKRARIHEILAENNLLAQETLFVGDMQHDIETARHGGVFACAVLTGYHSLAQLRASGPDLIVEHLGELREIMQRNALEMNPRSAAEEDQSSRLPVSTVGALIFDERGNVLMLRTHKWSNLWGIPGGKIKFGESAIDALRREIKEETNLDITGIEFALVQDCIHSREFYRDAHFVLLNYTCHCVGEGNVRLNDEAVEFRWVTMAEALQLDLNQPTRILLDAVAQEKAPHLPGVTQM